ncbi:MAG: hypothetical protein IJT73_00680 [Selenomonadaceae bacterium]|nr:hypothetical protein [Selenomonadaceae bacterium]
MGNVNLKIDCSQLTGNDTLRLVNFLRKFLVVQVAGGDLIFASGRIDSHKYGNIWRVLNWLKVRVD